MSAKLSLLSIEDEAAACRAAWEGYEVGTLAHCLHHDEHFEVLNEPAENRISYILSDKFEEERVLRLHLFRPVKSAALAPARKAYHAALASALKAYDAALAPAWKAYDAALASAHAEEFPDCTWNGWTIFAGPGS